MRLLEEKHGITTHRTTIPSDIDLLIKSGMEIEVIESKPKKYYLNDYARMFSLPELKMLVDAVASSKFITKKKSDELIEKIAALGAPSSIPSLKLEPLVRRSHQAGKRADIFHHRCGQPSDQRKKKDCFPVFPVRCKKRAKAKARWNVL